MILFETDKEMEENEQNNIRIFRSLSLSLFLQEGSPVENRTQWNNKHSVRRRKKWSPIYLQTGKKTAAV